MSHWHLSVGSVSELDFAGLSAILNISDDGVITNIIRDGIDILCPTDFLRDVSGAWKCDNLFDPTSSLHFSRGGVMFHAVVESARPDPPKVFRLFYDESQTSPQLRLSADGDDASFAVDCTFSKRLSVSQPIPTTHTPDTLIFALGGVEESVLVEPSPTHLTLDVSTSSDKVSAAITSIDVDPDKLSELGLTWLGQEDAKRIARALSERLSWSDVLRTYSRSSAELNEDTDFGTNDVLRIFVCLTINVLDLPKETNIISPLVKNLVFRVTKSR
jgi:hypothetical protein